MIESTEPGDLEKRLFFWNLNGAIQEAPPWQGLPKFLAGFLIDWRITLHLFVIIRALDNYPVFVDLISRTGTMKVGMGAVKKLEALITHIVLFVAATFGAAFGMRAVESRFTPEELYMKWTHSEEETNPKKAV